MPAENLGQRQCRALTLQTGTHSRALELRPGDSRVEASGAGQVVGGGWNIPEFHPVRGTPEHRVQLVVWDSGNPLGEGREETPWAAPASSANVLSCLTRGRHPLILIFPTLVAETGLDPTNGERLGKGSLLQAGEFPEAKYLLTSEHLEGEGASMHRVRPQSREQVPVFLERRGLLTC